MTQPSFQEEPDGGGGGGGGGGDGRPPGWPGDWNLLGIGERGGPSREQRVKLRPIQRHLARLQRRAAKGKPIAQARLAGFQSLTTAAETLGVPTQGVSVEDFLRRISRALQLDRPLSLHQVEGRGSSRPGRPAKLGKLGSRQAQRYLRGRSAVLEAPQRAQDLAVARSTPEDRPTPPATLGDRALGATLYAAQLYLDWLLRRRAADQQQGSRIVLNFPGAGGGANSGGSAMDGMSNMMVPYPNPQYISSGDAVYGDAGGGDWLSQLLQAGVNAAPGIGQLLGLGPSGGAAALPASIAQVLAQLGGGQTGGVEGQFDMEDLLGCPQLFKASTSKIVPKSRIDAVGPDGRCQTWLLAKPYGLKVRGVRVDRGRRRRRPR